MGGGGGDQSWLMGAWDFTVSLSLNIWPLNSDF